MIDPADDDPVIDVSSPACSMAEADDAYMGYAGREELSAILNELLAAERAGGTLDAAGAAAPTRTDRPYETVWGSMLVRHIKALGANVIPWAAAIGEKAPAISDPGAGLPDSIQSRVVRKLRATVPRVRDLRLRRDLTEMLRSREAHIALASKPPAVKQ